MPFATLSAATVRSKGEIHGVFGSIQGLETQVEKSIKELIPAFLEIGRGLSKHNRTGADVTLTARTRYT